MGLVGREKSIIVTPRTEWSVIAAEGGTVGAIYRNYVVPLALIPAICSFVGMAVLGFSLGADHMRVPFFSGLIMAALQFGLGLLIVYLIALVIDALAPRFDGRKGMLPAFKLAAYSYTPAWLTGIFLLVPVLGFLSILGLYGIYLLYVGAPRLMAIPEGKAGLFTTAVVVIALIMSFVLSLVLAAFMPVPAMM
nr:MAG: YIP1 family protein [Pseudomonadota bacterium]